METGSDTKGIDIDPVQCYRMTGCGPIHQININKCVAVSECGLIWVVLAGLSLSDRDQTIASVDEHIERWEEWMGWHGSLPILSRSVDVMVNELQSETQNESERLQREENNKLSLEGTQTVSYWCWELVPETFALLVKLLYKAQLLFSEVLGYQGIVFVNMDHITMKDYYALHSGYERGWATSWGRSMWLLSMLKREAPNSPRMSWSDVSNHIGVTCMIHEPYLHDHCGPWISLMLGMIRFGYSTSVLIRTRNLSGRLLF